MTITHSFSRFTAALALFGAIALSACSSAEATSAEPTADGPPPGSIALPAIGGASEEKSSDALSTQSVHGGTGGTDAWINCPSFIGLAGRFGNYIDLLQPYCSNGGAPYPSNSVGHGGGEHQFDQFCPAGYVATGIQGRAHTYVDALGLICTSTTNYYDKFTIPVQGGGGGDGFWDDCPQGQKLTWLHVKAGNWLDRIEPFCGPM